MALHEDGFGSGGGVWVAFLRSIFKNNVPEGITMRESSRLHVLQGEQKVDDVNQRKVLLVVKAEPRDP
jgi:hypothetical protein